MTQVYSTQNDLLLNNLLEFYKGNDNMDKMLNIINGESRISLRIIDWFATNYAKKYYTVYDINDIRFKVYSNLFLGSPISYLTTKGEGVILTKFNLLNLDFFV